MLYNNIVLIVSQYQPPSSIPSPLLPKITPFYEVILTAGAVGLEPTVTVLETVGLPLTDAPNLNLACHSSFFMDGAFSAPFAKLFKLQFSFNGLLVFIRIVIRPFANRAF